MTAFAAAQISKDRLRLWQKRNEHEGIACTPAILVSLRHDDGGTLILNTVEEQDLSDEFLRGLLLMAADELQKRIEKRQKIVQDN